MKVFWRSTCGQCGFDGLDRLPRSFWMRLLPRLRHYHCGKCDSHVLAPKLAVEARQWAMTTTKNLRATPAPHADERR